LDLRAPAEDDCLLVGSNRGVWRDHDYRNWRRRHFEPAEGRTHASYDPRHRVASLLLHEGNFSIVDRQLREGSRAGDPPHQARGTRLRSGHTSTRRFRLAED
jgi:hypothetical protein